MKTLNNKFIKKIQKLLWNMEIAKILRRKDIILPIYAM